MSGDSGGGGGDDGIQVHTLSDGWKMNMFQWSRGKLTVLEG